MLAPEPVIAADMPHFWMGKLSMLIACFLAGQMGKSDMRAMYREFLRSPACSQELRAMLREVSR